MRRRGYAILLLVTFAILGVYYGTEPAPHQISRQRLLLGTVVEIVARGSDAGPLEESVNAAFTEIARIERLMSPHLPDSDVSRLSAARAAQSVSADTASVIALGLQVAAASDGAFDMTLGRLKKLWDIQAESPRIPRSDEIKAALSAVGPRSLSLRGQTVVKSHPITAVDLGAIAKGYALDRAADLLRQRGISSASLNAGGDLALIGGRTAELPWRIGIQNPTIPEQTIATLELRNRAVVTSGDYERFFEADGIRFHHILDPATGYPGRRSRSVTIIADSAALADALATAAFILGPEGALKLLDHFPEAEGLIIDPSGKKYLTSGMAQVLTWH